MVGAKFLDQLYANQPTKDPDVRWKDDEKDKSEKGYPV